ncbi:MAG: thiamine pyrophosphate-binding protein [Thermodesulfobacteriota bacterium]
MNPSGGELIADILRAHGVRFLFTLTGGHIAPILVGCHHRGIRVVDVRDEVNAVFAADAVARLTGIPGVAAVTAGPGVTNTITALKNAQMAQSPLILLGGAAATLIRGRGSLQDIDQISLLKSVVKMAVTINRNCDIAPAMEHAFQTARSGVPGPVFVECPIDLLYSEKLVREWYGAKSRESGGNDIKSKLFQFYMNRHVNNLFACDLNEVKTRPRGCSFPEVKTGHIIKAEKILEGAHRPVLIVGSQAMLEPSQSGRLLSSLERMAIPVFLAGMARGVMGKSHHLQMRHHRKEALKKADVVVIAGMPCDFRLGYGMAINSRATLIAINRSKADLMLNRKPELAVHADPAQFLAALAERFVPGGRSRDWTASLRSSDDDRENEIRKMAEMKTDGVHPLRLLTRLEDFLTDESILVADGGDFVATASYVLRPRAPLSWLDPGVFGTLGVGAGFATGAKLCRPDAEVWLIYGDGAAGYSLQEFDTFVRHGLPVIAVVGNDAAWAQIAREQIELFHNEIATVLRRSDYHTVAAGFGGMGILVTREEEIQPALESARHHAREGIPVLINVHIGKTDFRKGSISM